tara:strand:- start:68 stop:370 length:303 start_codon:yes stop_codon:yes gene_type:complete
MKKLLALLLLFGIGGCSSEASYECGYGFDAKISANKSELTQILISETGNKEQRISKSPISADNESLFTFGQHVYIFKNEDESLQYVNRTLNNKYRPCKKI